MNKSKVLMLKAGAIMSLLAGILYIVSLVGILIGIFNIAAYAKMKAIYSRPLNEAIMHIDNAKSYGWSIYIMLTAPLGFLAFLPYVCKRDNEPELEPVYNVNNGYNGNNGFNANNGYNGNGFDANNGYNYNNGYNNGNNGFNANANNAISMNNNNNNNF